jgi:hypothetical protein
MKTLKLKAARWLNSILVSDPLSSQESLQADPSQLGESRILEFILKALNNQGHEIPRTFLELGANSPYSLSCTWYLEKTSGFKGVSIDPLSHISHDFLKHRKNTCFINKAFLPGTQIKEVANYFKCDSSVLSTSDKNEAEAMQKMGHTFTSIEVGTVGTEELFQYYDERIGILIIDIESLPLQIEIISEIVSTRLKPFIICVETLDYSPTSSNLRHEYDHLLKDSYKLIAGTYLNSIYLSLDLSTE